MKLISKAERYQKLILKNLKPFQIYQRLSRYYALQWKLQTWWNTWTILYSFKNWWASYYKINNLTALVTNYHLPVSLWRFQQQFQKMTRNLHLTKKVINNGQHSTQYILMKSIIIKILNILIQKQNAICVENVFINTENYANQRTCVMRIITPTEIISYSMIQ